MHMLNMSFYYWILGTHFATLELVTSFSSSEIQYPLLVNQLG